LGTCTSPSGTVTSAASVGAATGSMTASVAVNIPSTTPSSTPSSIPSSTPIGVVVGGVLGGVAVLALIACAAAWFCYRRRKGGRKPPRYSDSKRAILPESRVESELYEISGIAKPAEMPGFVKPAEMPGFTDPKVTAIPGYYELGETPRR
jgi:hypothetical protein